MPQVFVIEKMPRDITGIRPNPTLDRLVTVQEHLQDNKVRVMSFRNTSIPIDQKDLRLATQDDIEFQMQMQAALAEKLIAMNTELQACLIEMVKAED